MNAALAAVTALGALALAACGTGSTYRTTRIAPPGHTEWLFAAQVTGAGTLGPGEGGAKEMAAPLPELAVAARRGLDERFEVQLNTTLLATRIASTGSIELAGKVRLAHSGRWSLATGAALGYRLAEAGGAIIEDVYAGVPVIGGVDLGRHQLVLTIDAGYHRAYSSGANPVQLPYVGDSLGFLWQIGKHWALLPEAGLAWSPTPNFMTDNSRLFHAGVAVVWTH